MAATLSKERADRTNSALSATGILRPSKTVPVAGLKERPQALHSQRSTPFESRPLRLIEGEPQRGAALPRVAVEEGRLALEGRRCVPVPVDVAMARCDERLGGGEPLGAPLVPRRRRRGGPSALLSAHGGSPCCPGGGRRQGLPHRESAAIRPGVLADGYSSGAIIRQRRAPRRPRQPQRARDD